MAQEEGLKLNDQEFEELLIGGAQRLSSVPGNRLLSRLRHLSGENHEHGVEAALSIVQSRNPLVLMLKQRWMQTLTALLLLLWSGQLIVSMAVANTLYIDNATYLRMVAYETRDGASPAQVNKGPMLSNLVPLKNGCEAEIPFGLRNISNYEFLRSWLTAVEFNGLRLVGLDSSESDIEPVVFELFAATPSGDDGDDFPMQLIASSSWRWTAWLQIRFQRRKGRHNYKLVPKSTLPLPTLATRNEISQQARGLSISSSSGSATGIEACLSADAQDIFFGGGSGGPPPGVGEQGSQTGDAQAGPPPGIPTGDFGGRRNEGSQTPASSSTSGQPPGTMNASGFGANSTNSSGWPGAGDGASFAQCIEFWSGVGSSPQTVRALDLDLRPPSGTVLFVVGRPFLWVVAVGTAIMVAKSGRLRHAGNIVLFTFGASAVLELVAAILLGLSENRQWMLLPLGTAIWDASMIFIFTWRLAGRFLAQRVALMGFLLLAVFAINAWIEGDLHFTELISDVPVLALFSLIAGAVGWRTKLKKVQQTKISTSKYNQRFEGVWAQVMDKPEEVSVLMQIERSIFEWRSRAENSHRVCFHRIRVPNEESKVSRGRLGRAFSQTSFSPKERVEDLDQLYLQATMLEKFFHRKILSLSEGSGGLLDVLVRKHVGDDSGETRITEDPLASPTRRFSDASEPRIFNGILQRSWQSWGEIRASATSNMEAEENIRFASIKPADRAISKATAVYGKDYSRVVDLCRDRLCFDKCSDLYDCLQRMMVDPEIDIRKIKSTLGVGDSAAWSAGFRYVVVNFAIRTPQTTRLFLEEHVTELLLILRSFAEIQAEMEHRQYINFRNTRALGESGEGSSLFACLPRMRSRKLESAEDSETLQDGDVSITIPPVANFSQLGRPDIIPDDCGPLEPAATLGGLPSAHSDPPTPRGASEAQLLEGSFASLGAGSFIQTKESQEGMRLGQAIYLVVEEVCRKAIQRTEVILDEQLERVASAMKSSSVLGAFSTTSPISSASAFKSFRLWLIVVGLLFYVRAIHVGSLFAMGNMLHAKHLKLSAMDVASGERMEPEIIMFAALRDECRNGLFVQPMNVTDSGFAQTTFSESTTNGINILPSLGFPLMTKLRIGVWFSEDGEDWVCMLPVSQLQSCEAEWLVENAAQFTIVPQRSYHSLEVAVAVLRGTGYLGAALMGFLGHETYAKTPIVASLPACAVALIFFTTFGLFESRDLNAPLNHTFGVLDVVINAIYAVFLTGLTICLAYKEHSIIWLQCTLSVVSILEVAVGENSFYRGPQKLYTAFLGDAFILLSCGVFSFLNYVYHRQSLQLIGQDKTVYDSLWSSLVGDPERQADLAKLKQLVDDIPVISQVPMQIFRPRFQLETWEGGHRSSKLHQWATGLFRLQSSSSHGSFPVRETNSAGSNTHGFHPRSSSAMDSRPESKDESTNSNQSQGDGLGLSCQSNASGEHALGPKNTHLISSMHQLFSQARIVQCILRQRVRQWSLHCNGKYCVKDDPSTFLTLREARARGLKVDDLKFGKLKSPSRALEKQLRCYNGMVARLTDVAREALVFESVTDLIDCLELIKSDPDVVVHHIKNRYRNDYNPNLTAGYRDLALNISLVTNDTILLNLEQHICEVQLLLQGFAAVRSDQGHRRYITFRNRSGQ